MPPLIYIIDVWFSQLMANMYGTASWRYRVQIISRRKWVIIFDGQLTNKYLY